MLSEKTLDALKRDCMKQLAFLVPRSWDGPQVKQSRAAWRESWQNKLSWLRAFEKREKLNKIADIDG